MSEVTKYEAQKKKLEGLCEEHDLTFRFRKEAYPITLTIRPVQGVEEQLAMLEEANGENYISPGASLTLIFADGELTSKVSGGTFTISKTLRAKIENIFLKMCSFWQQYFFRYLIQTGTIARYRNMPVIDESDPGVDEPDEEEDLDPGVVDDVDQDDEEDPEDNSGEDASTDDLIQAATQLVRSENKASISLLQRRLKIGYSRAARIITALEDSGVIGPYKGSEPREVLPYDIPEEA